jgi:3-dehydroquinate dehydratase-2
VKILVINGPNLNLLGEREPGLYGNRSLEEINAGLGQLAEEKGISLEFFQSNHEGALIDTIQAARGRFDGIIINAGGLTHTSVALHDALKATDLPVFEVHISNIYQREVFRHQSLISPVAVGGIFGLGPMGYRLALEAACELLATGKK